MNKLLHIDIEIYNFIIIILVICSGFCWGKQPKDTNVKQRGNMDIDGVISLTAINGTYKALSKVDTPTLRESICVDVYQQSTIPKLADVPAGTVICIAYPNKMNQVANLEWYVNGAKVQDGGLTYTFSADNKIPSIYKVEAKLDKSIKAINIYVVKCSYYLLVENTLNKRPVDISAAAKLAGNYVGHTSWALYVSPTAAKKVKPFNEYIDYINDYAGFHANGRPFWTGLSQAPQPTIHIPDIILASKVKDYPVSMSTLVNMLKDTKACHSLPGDYILGTYGRIIWNLNIIEWHYGASRNCVTTALDIGKNNGLANCLPHSYTVWAGPVKSFFVMYSGDAPCELFNNL